MNKKDEAQLLNSPLFTGVEPAQLRFLLAKEGVETAAAAKGELIYSPDSFRRSLAVILSGAALVTKPMPDGHSVIMSRLERGAVFGMAALFYEQDFLTEVRAEKNCRVLFLERAWLEAAFRESPQLTVNYVTILSERIHFLNKRIETFAGGDSRERLLHYLTGFMSETVALPFSMDELAKALGLGRASLYRAFDALENEGILTRKGRVVHFTENPQWFK